MAPGDPRDRRFVVLGFPRSGTTLLRRLLDAHPEVSCPPETNLVSACGRFLESAPTVDGLTVGVLSGLEFCGIPRADLLDELRRLVFGLHERIAAGKPVWVEKTAFDIFHLEQVEELLAGHCRFIAVVRNPLDVIVSVKELFDGMDQILPEMLPFVRRHASLYDAYAEAWIDRTEALDGFVRRHADDCLVYRYEDLVADPAGKLAEITGFLGVAPASDEIVRTAFEAESKVGLGDWNTYATHAVSRASVERWRTVLPPSTAARLLPSLAPLIEAHGYDLPKVRPIPKGADAVRMYQLAKHLRQTIRDQG